MKNPVLSQLEELRSARDSARDAAIQMASAEGFDPQDRSFVDLEERAVKLDSQIERLVGLLDAQKSADALDGKLARSATRVEERDAAPTDSDWGQAFISSDQYRDFASRKFKGASQTLEIETRALPHSLASMADAAPSNQMFDLTPAATANQILPLVTTIPVTQNAIDYIVWSKVAGNAAVVVEGALKPSIEWDPTVTSSTLETIAAHTSFTRQMAEDLPTVRAFLTNELQREVSRKVEALAVSALGSLNTTVTGTAGSGVLGAIRKGKAAVEANGFTPNAFLVHSDDLVDLDLAVMNTSNSAPNSTNVFWGMRPVVDINGIVARGEVLVGDFKAGVHHYARNSVSLYLTDSHADNFRLNILDALAEVRSKTVIVRPAALVQVVKGA